MECFIFLLSRSLNIHTGNIFVYLFREISASADINNPRIGPQKYRIMEVALTCGLLVLVKVEVEFQSFADVICDLP